MANAPAAANEAADTYNDQVIRQFAVVLAV